MTSKITEILKEGFGTGDPEGTLAKFSEADGHLLITLAGLTASITRAEARGDTEAVMLAELAGVGAASYLVERHGETRAA